MSISAFCSKSAGLVEEDFKLKGLGFWPKRTSEDTELPPMVEDKRGKWDLGELEHDNDRQLVVEWLPCFWCWIAMGDEQRGEGGPDLRHPPRTSELHDNQASGAPILEPRVTEDIWKRIKWDPFKFGECICTQKN